MIITLFNINKSLIKSIPYLFCQKRQILKTYLEVIPPHRLYQIQQNTTHMLQNAIQSLQKGAQLNLAINKQSLNYVLKQTKKRTTLIPFQLLIRIAELAARQGNLQIQLKKAYSKIIRITTSRVQQLPLQQIVQIVYKLAKLGKRQYELMKQVEKVILQVKLRANYPLIRKILFTYTHLDIGSSVLYSHIAKTLTIVQNQLRPLQLAESAYMLSKVSQNAKGGYGVFSIAQKHIHAVLPRLSFSQLVKSASYLLTQDLGSNKFQTQLQQALYNTYPAKDRLKIVDFTALLKATSGYFFKFKQNALLHMLKTSTVRMVQFATPQQFEDIVWSWGRLGKGDRQVWSCLQNQIQRRMAQMKPRQLVFAYYSLCSTNNSTMPLLKRMQKCFMQLSHEELNEHLLLKFLLGMHRKKLYEQQSFVIIAQVLSRRIDSLSNTQLVSFVKLFNQSDLDYESSDKIRGLLQSIQIGTKKLQAKLYMLKLTEIAQILYLLVKFQIKNKQLQQNCMLALHNVIEIPKSVFIKTIFAFTIKEKYLKALQMIPILVQLTKYGPLGYFFSPYQFPLLCYCLLHMQINGQNVNINKKLLHQADKTLKQIQPVMLNKFVLKAYNQAIKLSQKMNQTN